MMRTIEKTEHQYRPLEYHWNMGEKWIIISLGKITGVLNMGVPKWSSKNCVRENSGNHGGTMGHQWFWDILTFWKPKICVDQPQLWGSQKNGWITIKKSRGWCVCFLGFWGAKCINGLFFFKRPELRDWLGTRYVRTTHDGHHCFFGQHFPSMRAGWSPVGMVYDSARHKSVCWCSKHQQTKSAKTIPKDWKIGMAPAPNAVAAAVAVLPAPATVVEEPQCCRCDFCVPSGNLLHSYWTWPIEIVNLHFKHSYFP